MAISEVSVDELAARMAQGGRLFDVREFDEYTAGHAPGAVLVPLSTVAEHIDTFRGDGPALLICRSGARSMQACNVLSQAGLDVVNIAGGTMAWINSGRDVVLGDQPR